MIYWFWKYKSLMRRLPVLMALLSGFMFTARTGQLVHVQSKHAAQQFVLMGESQSQQPAGGEETPVFEPGFQALAQVAPLQIFLYQPAILPVIFPLVEIVEQAPATVPDLANNFLRILFRRIISPNAP